MNSWMEEIAELCREYFSEHGVTSSGLDGWHRVANSINVELHHGFSKRSRGCLFDDIVIAHAPDQANLHKVCAHELTEALLRTETAIPPFQIPNNMMDPHHMIALNMETYS